MELQIFSMYDKKTTIYGRPFYAHNSGHAMRLVLDEASNQDSQLSKYPADFQLCKIGSFDDQLGTIDPQEVAVVIEINDLIKKD